MAKKWRDLIATMPPESRARARAAAERLRREFPLVEVRRQLNLSQQSVAEKAGVSKATVSRLERQSGTRLRELRRYVEAMGGELEITARFADGKIRLDRWERERADSEADSTAR